MNRVDILFLAYNRLRYTQRSWQALLANTDWSLVRRMYVHDDGSSDGTAEFLATAASHAPVPAAFHSDRKGHPVAVMNYYLDRWGAPRMVKIDNDVLLPPGWLEQSLEVAERDCVDILGLEAMYPVVAGAPQREFMRAEHIGGVGLLRREAFTTLPEETGQYFGFTAWQSKNCDRLRIGWLNPALPVCLLDRMHFGIWPELGRQYIEQGWQRPWAPYDETCTALWAWWNPEEQ
jgi:glycosyltransferase involved in cell wall biosynthesis